MPPMQREHHVDPAVERRLSELSAAHDLPPEAPERFATLLALVAAERSAITSVRDPVVGVDVHVADSLVGLAVPALREARRLADLGAGAGFPGLALAIASPRTRVTLVESVERKCRFLVGAIEALGLTNADVAQARAEAWPEGMGAFDVITARALAPLPVIVEYAAPLLVEGGTLVAWKGAVDAAEASDGAAAARHLGLEAPRRLPVDPFAAARTRALYVSAKVGPTPSCYPRRPGIARKRPLRAAP